ncbi:MAG: GNAT family N-acetyltransferase [Gemmatimonadota bacterium]|nr:GNAT family N-acetyltransferase [Gemmatimonadota bacterium]
MSDFILRPLAPDDRAEYADMLHASFNHWYSRKGWPGDYFRCDPHDTGIFLDVYEDLTPGCNVAAYHARTGRLAGSCFYHPRPKHISFGIMSVHPNYFGKGIGKAMTMHIAGLAEEADKPLRLVGSAFNIDSFSLYNSSGFVPRESYNDMVITVPTDHSGFKVPGIDHVRPATEADVDAMAVVEEAVSGITRHLDYGYAIRNDREMFDVLVYENDQGGLDGFLISVKHPALNMMGPAVARNEAVMAALLARGAEFYRGSAALVVIPMQKRALVELMYSWKAVNVETHLFQVRGEFYGFDGVNLPSFLPETG